jgi:hypothetical protein
MGARNFEKIKGILDKFFHHGKIMGQKGQLRANIFTRDVTT